MTLLVHDVFASFKEICWLFRRINIEKVSQLLVVTRSDNIGELTQLLRGVPVQPRQSSQKSVREEQQGNMDVLENEEVHHQH